jgi:HEAT repeat protein
MRAWLERYGVPATILALTAAAGISCLVWWVPIAARWHIQRLASDEEGDRAEARAALADLGPRGVPTLIRFAHHQNRRIRLGVAQVLGDLGTGEALEALVPMVRDRDEEVRHAAIWTLLSHPAALARCGHELALEWDHPDPVVRLCAIIVMPRDNLATTVDRFLAAMDESDSLVRLAAYRRLCALTHQSFPFEAFAADQARAEALTRWRVWWQAERRRLPGDRAAYRGEPASLS